MARKNAGSGQDLPSTFTAFRRAYPQLEAVHGEVARVVEQSGPLDRRTCELIKIGICLGAGLESALRSHVRRALEQGATPPTRCRRASAVEPVTARSGPQATARLRRRPPRGAPRPRFRESRS